MVPLNSMAIYLSAVREANDACLWLRAAGFPQYVQMFEGEWCLWAVCLCTMVCSSSVVSISRDYLGTVKHVVSLHG